MHHVCIAKIVIDSRHFLLCLSSQDCEAIIGLSAEVFDLTVVQLKWPFKLFKIRQMDLLRFKWMKKRLWRSHQIKIFLKRGAKSPLQFSGPLFGLHYDVFARLAQFPDSIGQIGAQEMSRSGVVVLLLAYGLWRHWTSLRDANRRRSRSENIS